MNYHAFLIQKIRPKSRKRPNFKDGSEEGKIQIEDSVYTTEKEPMSDDLKIVTDQMQKTHPPKVKNNAEVIECHLCDDVFESKAEYRKHIKTVDHTAVGVYVCYLCGIR